MSKQVVITGGGIIGTACAHYLVKSGWRVTLIDRGQFGRGCSHGNCGFICPSHVLPLAVPGTVGRAFKALFQPNSPLSIKPRLDPSLWRWLFHFARRCNVSDMLGSGRAIQALLKSSRALYDDLFQTEPLEAEWETHGLLFVFLTAEAMNHYADTDRLLRENFGLAATRNDSQALINMEPALKPGLAGGWHYLTDGHLRPDKLLSSWRNLLISQGVAIHEHCEFQGFSRGENRADAIRTSTGEMSADAFVVAAGHNMLGLSMAPATGKFIAELVNGQTPHIDPAPYSPARF